MEDELAAKNTDVEIWRKVPDDYYSPSIHVTEQGDIGINVGGYVQVASVEQWFAAGKAAFCLNGEAREEFEELVDESATGQGGWESRANLFPDYVGHPPAWELTLLDI